MIRFEFGNFWWIIGIPLMILLSCILERIHQKYTMPVILDFPDLLRKTKSDKKRILYATLMIVLFMIYILLFLYSIAFIVKLTVEAEFSWVGFSMYLLLCILSILVNYFLEHVKKRLQQ